MSLTQRQKSYLHLMGINVFSERVEVEQEEYERQEFNSKIDINESQLPVENPTQPSVSELTEQVASVTETLTREIPVSSSDTLNDVEVSVHDVLKRSELPDDWSGLIDQVSVCTRCNLHKTRTQTVFGTGDIQADWMIIGDSPGIDEDKQGVPFLGKHGDLLNSILNSIDLGRNKVYIANSVKCKPPGNRDTNKTETAQCRAYLEQQIALLNPKIIICVGRLASQNLLQVDDPISRLRGKPHSIQHPVKLEKNIPVIVTYHPAYLLRSPSQKRKVWDDLKLAFSVLDK